jgi:hypothetical protein
MANTYTLIASSTVGSGGASSIDFTSIPSTYTDLLLKCSFRITSGGFNYATLTFNGSSSGYTARYVEGNGSAASSGTATNAVVLYNSSTSTTSTFASTDLYIPNYAGSNYKSVSVDTVTENNATSSYADLFAVLWSNSAAINQVTLTAGLVQYSTAYLYGIKNS